MPVEAPVTTAKGRVFDASCVMHQLHALRVAVSTRTRRLTLPVNVSVFTGTPLRFRGHRSFEDPGEGGGRYMYTHSTDSLPYLVLARCLVSLGFVPTRSRGLRP